MIVAIWKGRSERLVVNESQIRIPLTPVGIAGAAGLVGVSLGGDSHVGEVLGRPALNGSEMWGV